MALSDGMGSGEKACRESTLVVELLEELLEAGFPEKTAIQMINTTLVMGREEIHYSTIDMSVFDLYTGECELIKEMCIRDRLYNKVRFIICQEVPVWITRRGMNNGFQILISTMR